MKRFIQLCTLLAMAVVIGSCGGGGMSDLDSGEAAVYLTVSDYVYGDLAYPDVCGGIDLTIQTLTIQSNPVSPDVVLNSTQDVVLTRWVVTPYRTDGGTVASPVWIHDISVTVTAGSQTTLNNYPFYPAYFYDDPPLSYLFPENGGFDPETGETVIEQGLRVVWYGRTMEGKAVNLDYVIYSQFRCGE